MFFFLSENYFNKIVISFSIINIHCLKFLSYDIFFVIPISSFESIHLIWGKSSSYFKSLIIYVKYCISPFCMALKGYLFIFCRFLSLLPLLVHSIQRNLLVFYNINWFRFDQHFLSDFENTVCSILVMNRKVQEWQCLYFNLALRRNVNSFLYAGKKLIIIIPTFLLYKYLWKFIIRSEIKEKSGKFVLTLLNWEIPSLI